MSATVDPAPFSNYFNGAPAFVIPPESQFPTRILFLEDALELTRTVVEEDGPYARRRRGARVDVTVGRGEESRSFAVDASEVTRIDADVEARFASYSRATKIALTALDQDRINFDIIADILRLKLAGEASLNPHPAPDDATLVFLPGWAEIQRLKDIIEGSRELGGCVVVALHSNVAPAQQRRAFATFRGFHKVVLATNIAETSITIDGVTCVIDSGLCREMAYDASERTNRLLTKRISRAAAVQRAGRAGRSRAGS
jgi:HrpA-like RNA helicase